MSIWVKITACICSLYVKKITNVISGCESERETESHIRDYTERVTRQVKKLDFLSFDYFFTPHVELLGQMLNMNMSVMRCMMPGRWM